MFVLFDSKAVENDTKPLQTQIRIEKDWTNEKNDDTLLYDWTDNEWPILKPKQNLN